MPNLVANSLIFNFDIAKAGEGVKIYWEVINKGYWYYSYKLLQDQLLNVEATYNNYKYIKLLMLYDGNLNIKLETNVCSYYDRVDNIMRKG